jgi:hypothetical protein
MTTGLTYSTYKTQIATMAVVEETNADFLTILPQAITYAENRIYRDLDLLQTSASITGYQLAIGTRTITIPAGTLVVSEQINVITPAGTSNPEDGTRNPLLPATKEFLDSVYGSSSSTGCRSTSHRLTTIFSMSVRFPTITIMWRSLARNAQKAYP